MGHFKLKLFLQVVRVYFHWNENGPSKKFIIWVILRHGNGLQMKFYLTPIIPRGYLRWWIKLIIHVKIQPKNMSPYFRPVNIKQSVIIPVSITFGRGHPQDLEWLEDGLKELLSLLNSDIDGITFGLKNIIMGNSLIKHEMFLFIVLFYYLLTFLIIIINHYNSQIWICKRSLIFIFIWQCALLLSGAMLNFYIFNHLIC